MLSMKSYPSYTLSYMIDVLASEIKLRFTLSYAIQNVCNAHSDFHKSHLIFL
jgi:hypothetical protein